ncbi:hypothetical protein DPMN_098802 [Dreissena polymorpha]|uniref:Mab-21-like HhH/H2TH-like domain-containing protein n=1 Tax=Dreissena polymorpha TaxID=45954 RepID=A0A9D4LEC8_DREPO|nr:hypothetical protein DPMN_098802 [Dreissena polymorpha]
METECKDRLSIRLSTVMEDIGVTVELVNFRRYITRVREYVKTIMHMNGWKDVATFHFVGSQIEGSTTLGMDSDYDFLITDRGIFTAYTDLSEFCPLQSYSTFLYLAIKNTYSFPQCVCLQRVIYIGENILFPVSAKYFDMKRKDLSEHLLDEDGRELLSNEIVINNLVYPNYSLHSSGIVEQHEPALNLMGYADSVFCIQCDQTLPRDCQVLFERPKPGHWPKEKTLYKAKTQCAVFFMYPGNIGHTSSYDSSSRMINMDIRHPTIYASRQWRMSTVSIELLLMCDLDIVQMKTYVLMKMIRIQFLKPLVADRLSTFHMKTAFLFAIEKYPPRIWTNENLVQCVLFGLRTLRRFLKHRFCPHYSIACVDLFAEKLRVWEVRPLIAELTRIINSNLQCVYEINIDKLGKRLNAYRTGHDSELVSRSVYRLWTLSPLITCFNYIYLGSYDIYTNDDINQMELNFKRAEPEETE